jgi:hypothetical protein
MPAAQLVGSNWRAGSRRLLVNASGLLNAHSCGSALFLRGGALENQVLGSAVPLPLPPSLYPLPPLLPSAPHPHSDPLSLLPASARGGETDMTLTILYSPSNPTPFAHILPMPVVGPDQPAPRASILACDMSGARPLFPASRIERRAETHQQPPHRPTKGRPPGGAPQNAEAVHASALPASSRPTAGQRPPAQRRPAECTGGLSRRDPS